MRPLLLLLQVPDVLRGGVQHLHELVDLGLLRALCLRGFRVLPLLGGQALPRRLQHTPPHLPTAMRDPTAHRVAAWVEWSMHRFEPGLM